MSAHLDRIEAMLTDIERMHAEAGGQFTERAEVREALALVSKIERRMIEEQPQFEQTVSCDETVA